MNLQTRRKAAQNLVAQSLYDIMEEKESNLAISLDIPQKNKFFNVLEQVAEHIAVLKIHIDIIEDFDQDFINRLLVLKEKYNFLIFEDRKFADIGNTVKLQYSRGIYHILEWADIINAHIFPGSGVIQGLREAWQESKYKERGLILIPQMTSSGNLFNEEVMTHAIEWSKEYSDFIIGFIGAANNSFRSCEAQSALGQQFDWEGFKEVMGEGSERNIVQIKKTTLEELRKESWPESIIFSPGIKLDQVEDSLGQTYVTPQMAVEQGTDIIIVGRGIYTSEEPGHIAAKYKKAGWQAYL